MLFIFEKKQHCQYGFLIYDLKIKIIHRL